MTRKKDFLELAKKVVKEGPDCLRNEIRDAKEFGKLWVFTKKESGQLIAFKQLITDYLAVSKPKKPLCLAVFGPPGSGKSFAVEQIKEIIEEEIPKWKDHLKFTTINLTQIADVRALADALLQSSKAAMSNNIPIVFFDEFDAPRNGFSLGWLSWFLAPMNDSMWRLDGRTEKLEKAIYIFAGGTTDCFSEFVENNLKEFRNSKGPDFVSRLSGYLDVKGPNASSFTPIRRAIILHHALAMRATLRGLDKKQGVKISIKLMDTFLRVGRFLHGARSINATINMSSSNYRTNNTLCQLKFEDLPASHLLAIHANRGPLDPVSQGGSIQLTGGAKTSKQKSLEPFWKCFATKLWSQGATISYGGITGKDTLTEVLKKEVKKLPQALENESIRQVRIRSFPPCFKKEPNKAIRISAEIMQEAVYGLSKKEYNALQKIINSGHPNKDVAKRVKASICLFRMRLQVAESSIATVAVGGKPDDWSGRFSGVAEEIMLALALGRPIYLCGAPGGLVKKLGGMLGLVRPWTEIPKKLIWPHNEYWKTFSELLCKYKNIFTPPPYENLPLTADDLIKFLMSHAIDGENWPYNGLTTNENRALFIEEDKEKAVKLIVRGLKNVGLNELKTQN
ncbi:AAA family ATPase [Planctomycetota bacterium]